MFGLDLDKDDHRSYEEQAAAVFAGALSLYVQRLATTEEVGVKRLASAYNHYSAAGDELRESQIRQYILGKHLPHPTRIFQMGEALGPRNQLNPEGCDLHEASGMLMLVLAGYLQHVVLLLDQAKNSSAFEPATMAEYLEPIYFFAQRSDDAAFFENAVALSKAQRQVLVEAWNSMPNKDRFSRVRVDGTLAEAWHTASDPTRRYYSKLFNLQFALTQALARSSGDAS